MEDKTKLIESLLESATDYGKTSVELIKLKVVDKTSDIVSTFIPNSLVIILIASFMLFFNLGLGFWLGEILGKIYYGFFVVAAFYGFLGIVLHLFMHNWIKRYISNSIIKKLLN
jgi:Flp pilus assembly protein protease CpaA